MGIVSALPRLLVCLCAIMLSACSVLPDVPAEPSYAYTNPEQTSLGKRWQAELEKQPGLSGFSLLDDSLDAFVARVVMIETAEHTLDVQYYTIQDDQVGRLIVQRLLAAADRGIRVRVLIDDIYGNRADKAMRLLEAHPQVEIRLFNPWENRKGIGKAIETVLNISRLNHRMHNKLMVADNAVAILGGRNIGDEYFNLNPDLDFHDIDVLAVGPVVIDASTSFDQFWNSEWARPIKADFDEERMDELRVFLANHIENLRDSTYVKALADSSVAKALRDHSEKLIYASAKVIADLPEKVVKGERAAHRANATFLSQLENVMPDPEKYLWISSPYFVPGDEGVRSLSALVKKGVDVQVLTNSFAANDVQLVHSGYAPYRKDLLSNGVGLFELKRDHDQVQPVRKRLFGSANASLHAKAFVMDDETVVIGSANMDPRSFKYNTEIALLITSEELAKQLTEWFRTVMHPQASYKVTLNEANQLQWYEESAMQPKTWDKEPETSWWDRLKIKVFSWLPIESQI